MSKPAHRPSVKHLRSAPYAALAQRSKRVILVTGFEAFGDDPSGQGLNPSALAALALHGQQIAGHTVVAAVLPCVFGQSIKVLKTLLKQHQPALVVCTGQAGGCAGISLERVAINLDDAPLPDNAGITLHNTPIIAKGPAAYFSTLPLQAIVLALQQQRIPCELSSSAGHFVCNHVFYALMHALRKSKTPGGFIHVPYLPEQAAESGAPSMEIGHIVQGLRLALQTASTFSS
jgi:pyroglutamyl-peptidase